MLTRWAAPSNATFPARRITALRAPLITSTADTPDLPSLEVITESQNRTSPPANSGYTLTDDSVSVWKNAQGKLYVPPDDEEVHLRIRVAAHCGLGGHRGYSITCTVIKDKLHWPTIDADVKALVQSCLVCLLSASGDKVPRTLGHQLHAERVGEFLHFDYLYIGESRTQDEYVLILKDDFSGYMFLRPFKSANAENIANTLLDYFSTFNPVLDWYSDQGRNFQNKMLEILASAFGCKHRFSTAYVPWSTGTVESVCKQFLRVMRALSSELRIAESAWPVVVPSIQSVINNSPSRHLDNRAPIEVHSRMKPGNPLSIALVSLQTRDVDSAQQVAILCKLKIDEMLHVLDQMHESVNESLSVSRTLAVGRHNAETHVRPFKPTVEDYVVVARARGPWTKMSCNWVRPHRITQNLSDFIVEVEHLLTEDKEFLLVSLVKPYADSSVGTPVEMRDIADFTDRVWCAVDKIKDVHKTQDSFEFLVSWKGMITAGDSWKPLPAMFVEIPSKVRYFFKRRRSTVAFCDAKRSIGL